MARVGQYVWDIEFEDMDNEELSALSELCEKIKSKRELRQKYLNELHDLIDRAIKDDVQLVYCSDDIYLNLSGSDANDFDAEEKEYWV